MPSLAAGLCCLADEPSSLSNRTISYVDIELDDALAVAKQIGV